LLVIVQLSNRHNRFADFSLEEMDMFLIGFVVGALATIAFLVVEHLVGQWRRQRRSICNTP
jgi:hypothetical protein